MAAKSWRYLVVCMVIVCLGIYLIRSYSFLSYTHPGNHDILVVEGWLDDEALDMAKAEFLNNHYKLLITTGFIYTNGILMGSDGKLVFYTNPKESRPADSNYITLTLRGTKANGEFPHFRVYADSLEIGSFYSKRKKNVFQFNVKSPDAIDSVSVVFDNDDYSKFRDRNLYFNQITLNGVVYPANSPNVSLYGMKSGKFYLRRKLSESTARDAANYLVRAGIQESLVVPIESRHKIRSKTYTSGLDLRNLLIRRGYFGNRSVTIYTQGLHARRTYVSFHKALTDTVALGIIACSDDYISPSNWWKSPKGWKEILYETAGLLYVTFFIWNTGR